MLCIGQHDFARCSQFSDFFDRFTFFCVIVQVRAPPLGSPFIVTVSSFLWNSASHHCNFNSTEIVEFNKLDTYSINLVF